MKIKASDLTKAVDLQAHSAGTGPLRTQRPEYKDYLPPCNRACPAGENVQAWLDHAQAGKYENAFQKLIEDNPFPSIMGRICVHPCETGCNRSHIDTTINIHGVERFIGDLAIENKWPVRFDAKNTGKRIMVIGSGPSGLSAAYHLARMGHEVEIFEAHGAAGGLIHYGVPAYRLPIEIRDAEIERVLTMKNVRIHYNHRVEDVLVEKDKGRFDAVFIGAGAPLNKNEPMTLTNAVPIMDAISVLYDLSQGKTLPLGKKVIIYGGGKLAMYLSRVMRRLNIETSVLYAGDRKAMPAYDFEADDAIAEGIDVQLLRSIREVNHNQFTIETMQLEKGKIVGTGVLETLQADALILASGQEADTSFLQNIDGIKISPDGFLSADEGRMTGHSGIFAGGDVLGGERSAIIAVGHGKKAAKYIDAFVNGVEFEKTAKHTTAFFRNLELWYKTRAPQQEQEKLPPVVAIRSFEEVVAGYDEKEARYEAQRCLSCGNCFECDGCFGACPEDAIIKLGPGQRYRFNYDLCTGCGVCFEQCPCHAIDMVPEPSAEIEIQEG